jgi:hypothetical protein
MVKRAKKEKFVVEVHEVYKASYVVEAASEEEAEALVKDGEGEAIEQSYEFVNILPFDLFTPETQKLTDTVWDDMFDEEPEEPEEVVAAPPAT